MMKNTFLKSIGWLTLLLLLWGGGLHIRREVLKQQTRTLEGKEVPFLMESALQFRMTQMVAETGTLPVVDEKVQVPEGVNMRQTYSVGAEWIYTALANWLPEDLSFATRVRWVSAGLFCLSIPFAAIWVFVRTGSSLGGVFAASVLIFSPAFAVRSSGLELSRENLAVPFFVCFLMAEALYQRESMLWKKRAWALLAAFSLTYAQCVWDLTQYVTGLWVVWSLACRVRSGEEPEQSQKFLLMAILVCLTLVSFFNPYLRAHGSFFSPVMALVYARALLAWMPDWRKWWLQLLVAAGFWALWRLLGFFFVENYSHFGELVTAKLRYLNQKPEDPALLTYAQRIMWTPALNSSTWLLTKLYFPIVLWLFGIAVLSLIWGTKKGRCRFPAEFFYAGFTLAVYVFFFRFHVFLILFLAAAIATLFAKCRQSDSIWVRWIFPVLGLLIYTGIESYFLLFFEPKPDSKQLAEQQEVIRILRQLGGSSEDLQKGNRWGRPGAAYGYVAELTDWLNTLPEPERGAVLANFGISASILAETGFPIVLHPKFETPGIRERVREFYEHLFLKSEKELRDWAVKDFNARYYVHGLGNFSDLDPRNSPRYMVNAMEPPQGAAIYTLENTPLEAFWFRPVFSNRRFQVYRIVTDEDLDRAKRFTRMAAMAYDNGDMETAEKRVMQALSFHWKYPEALMVLRALRQQPVSP